MFTKSRHDFNTFLSQNKLKIGRKSDKNRKSIGSSARSRRPFGEMSSASRRNVAVISPKGHRHFAEMSTPFRRYSEVKLALFCFQVYNYLIFNLL